MTTSVAGMTGRVASRADTSAAQGLELRNHLGDRSSNAGLVKLLAVLRKLVFRQILGIDNARRFSWNLFKRTVNKGQH